MNRATFDAVLSGPLRRVVDGIRAQHPSMSWPPGWEKKLFTAYQAQRKRIRKQMNLRLDYTQDRIDRHKIAAAVAAAILSVRPIVPGLDTSAGARLANETFAVQAGALVVWYFVLQRIRNEAPEHFTKCKDAGFAFPPTGDENYVAHASKMLYHWRKRGTLGNLVLANLFFLLESFQLSRIGYVLQPLSKAGVAAP